MGREDKSAEASKRAKPDEKAVIEYLRSKGGSATNDEMYADSFGDVERGWETVRLLRKMADKGKLELEIQFTPRQKTTIFWRLKE